MPHTKHKKRKQTSKRIEVTGEDGWTRVTNTNTARRTPKSLPFATSHLDGSENPWRTVPEEGATKEKLRAKYDEIERQWLASDSCKALTTLLGDRIRAGGLQVDKCIVFGTSSFCGLRLGWIKNDVNAMCQLAVLRTMQVTIGNVVGSMPLALAQDPAYNDLDLEFLESYDITTIETPHGFDSLTEKSLAYTPGAEMNVDIQVLSAKPAILLTGRLDWYWRNEKGLACTDRISIWQEGEGLVPQAELGASGFPEDQRDTLRHQEGSRLEQECQIFEDFLRGRQEASLPDLDFKDHPFRNQHLYWLDKPDDGGDE